jgi:hypothetical protein
MIYVHNCYIAVPASVQQTAASDELSGAAMQERHA